MKKLISYILIFTIIFSFSITSMAEVVRSETVYINLDQGGGVENIKIIGHLSGQPSDDYYLDYGNYDDIKVLRGSGDPIVEKDLIKWDKKSLEAGDIYYEGRLDKDLPLDIKIKYFLDNKEIPAKDLAGKSGDLKISIKIENSHDLTSQIQVPLNMDKFKNIQAEGGVRSLVGSTMTLVFTHLPMGDKEYIIEAQAQDIELGPITIAATDSSSLMGDGIGDFDELIEAMKHMSKAVEEMEKGSNDLAQGTGKIQEGFKSLGQGIGRFLGGIREIGRNLEILVGGFNEFNLGLGQMKDGTNDMVGSVNTMNEGLKELASQGSSIEAGLGALDQGVNDLGLGIDGLAQGLNGLNMGHKELVGLAQSLADNPDPRVKTLVEGIIGEGMALEELAGGLDQANMGIKSLGENTSKLAGGFGQFNQGLANISGGFNQVNEGIKSLPQEINTMYEGHTRLVEGLNALNTGMTEALAGGDELEEGAKALGGGLEEILDGQNQLSQGLNELNEKGLKQVNKSLDKFLDSEGEGGEAFTSFVDKRNNENSSVQILMQTKAIKIEKDPPKIQEDLVVKKTIFERFLDLFKSGKK